MQDARNLIRYGGMHPETDILQFDPALSYGLVEYLRTIEMLEAHGWSRTRCVPVQTRLLLRARLCCCVVVSGSDSFDSAIFAGGGGGGGKSQHGGHLFALHIAAGLGLGGNEAYPGVFEPFGGFVDGVTPEDGFVRIPTKDEGCVGIGIELKASLYAEFTPLLAADEAMGRQAIPHVPSHKVVVDSSL